MTRFEETHSFGQSGLGKRCRVCLQGTYFTSNVHHRWWCPARWLKRLR